MRWSVVVSAAVASLVGLGGTLAILVAAAQAVGADALQTSSWVSALCLATAVASFTLSLRHRIPIVTAWSTPGAALIASAPGQADLASAVGAFLFANALILLTAAIRPLGALIERIPSSIAGAMLAGILLRFVVAMFDSAQAMPMLVLPLLGLFLVIRLVTPAGAVLTVLFAGIGLAYALGHGTAWPGGAVLSTLVFTAPRFETSILIGLGLPLFLVTMASQNLPGFAVLRAAGYAAPSRAILAVTGFASILTAPFGAHATNAAAITASICTGPDAHPDPQKRWLTGIAYGICFALLAAFGTSLTAFFQAMPPALIVTVAGTALVAPLAGALGTAMTAPEDRVAAALTLAVTASGVPFLGIGSAFWGLAAGLVALGLSALNARGRGGS
ncbi:MAG: benzoate/H(+) symporter BenE family transporter [Alphaproteobacteria bacterium]|nr:benzoate/H(+) symporter BenE family transporter [Alphaproteobacteria bacterium]